MLVLADQGPGPAWKERLVDAIRLSAEVDVRCDPPLAGASPRPLGARLWDLFLALDRRWHPVTPDAYARGVAWQRTLSAARPSSAGGRTSSASVDGADPAADEGADQTAPDIVLDLRSAPRPTGLRPHHGVWTLTVHGGPPTVSPVITTVLRIDDGSGDAPAEVDWSTAADERSAYRSLDRSAWNGYQLVLRELRLADSGIAEVRTAARRPPAAGGAPRAIEVIRFVVRSLALGVRRRARSARGGADWYIATRAKRWRTLSERDDLGFRALDVPPGHFHADPFLLARDGRTFLFFEDYSYRERRGAIAYREVSAAGAVSGPETVLRRPHHLSYPFVFALNGSTYLIPETIANRDVELFRAHGFPRDWRLDRVLMRDIHASDATLFQHEGTLWLFATVAEPGTSDWDALHVFFADSLGGEWRPHPLNPVVRDVRRARPAGRLFWDTGRLMRPAQDCSGRYGRAITLNRVDVLTRTGYSEAPVSQITAGWAAGNVATHGLDHTDDIEVIDGRRPGASRRGRRAAGRIPA